MAIMIVLFAKCVNKPAELRRYELMMSKDEIDYTGTNMSPGFKSDTLMAVNDTTAYTNAVRSFTAVKEAEKLTKNAISVTHSFTLLDSAGLDVRNKLPKNVIDSIHNVYISLRPTMKKYLKQ